LIKLIIRERENLDYDVLELQLDTTQSIPRYLKILDTIEIV